MMLHRPEEPARAYRRVAVEARIRSADPGELTLLCFEEVQAGLALALRGQGAQANARRSEGLLRAHAAIMALEMGLDRKAALAEALARLYAGARAVILASVSHFDAPALQQLANDFAEIHAALAAAQTAAPSRPHRAGED